MIIIILSIIGIGFNMLYYRKFTIEDKKMPYHYRESKISTILHFLVALIPFSYLIIWILASIVISTCYLCAEIGAIISGLLENFLDYFYI